MQNNLRSELQKMSFLLMVKKLILCHPSCIAQDWYSFLKLMHNEIHGIL